MSTLATFQTRLSNDGSKADAVLSGDVTNVPQAKATLSAFIPAVREHDHRAVEEIRNACGYQ